MKFLFSQKVVMVGLLVWPAFARGQASRAAATQADRPRCGVMVDTSLHGVAAASLFEAAMLQDSQIVPVERTDLDKIISEQELTAMFSPEAVSKRWTLGEKRKR